MRRWEFITLLGGVAVAWQASNANMLFVLKGMGAPVVGRHPERPGMWFQDVFAVVRNAAKLGRIS